MAVRQRRRALHAKLGLAAAGAAALLLAGSAVAKHHRSSWARTEFAREHPCPNPAGHGTHCPGFVIDHRQALCVGGVDAPSNMAWQTVEDAKAKDRWECRPGWEQRLKAG